MANHVVDYLPPTVGKLDPNSSKTTHKHGDKVECPNCNAPGQLDLSDFKQEQAFDQSIWWNPASNYWECTDCWLK